MNAQIPGGLSKWQRYRARKKASGFREIRLWVPDRNSPAFQDEMQRAATVLRGSDDERDVMDFIWTAMEETMKDEPY
jgi:Protein  of unknown function (DUF3018)